MMSEQQMLGGATIGVLNRLETWEANLVLNLRLWFEGTDGQSQVWNEYRRLLPGAEAKEACHAFEGLIQTITGSAHRPLVRHAVHCACLGSDEGIFLHLVRTASQGHLSDAALIATLLVGASQAEKVALLAGQVGACARKIHPSEPEFPPMAANNVVRLH